MADTLPPIPIWQTRSFWYAVATLAAVLARTFFQTELDANRLADTVMAILPLFTGALAYRERMNPKRRVVITRKVVATSALLLALGLSLMPGPTLAQGMACGDRTAIVQRLAEKYGEARRGIGLQRDAGVLEVYASDATGTFTIIITMPSGKACLVAAGDGWEQLHDDLATGEKL
ncbi:hypothetical protein FDP22_12660 [Paroceanicella profunda]|uniref:Uncharacterized protein n=1 Tax=Paroceanicella profunda TaxID=2579971 RepID=A0A5B8G0E9_9RHOB|nr:hypothetical protein [Paroceanicella profunda]QDL92559.1 hypothetical protein FDP22_12660 [Paroceanicella profunda]